jgi:5-methylcytosine-specific restriction endonuclease McrA
MRELASTVERFDPLEVYERDGLVCGLCSDSVDRDLAWPDPMSPSLDHVIPLSAGGDHSRANTQIAHWIFNVRKGARLAEDAVLGSSEIASGE